MAQVSQMVIYKTLHNLAWRSHNTTPPIMAINQPNLLEASKSSISKITLFLIFISFAALVSTCFSSPQLPLHHKFCDQSDNKESCLAMISEAMSVGREYSTKRPNMADHPNLLKAFLQKTTPRIQKAFKMANDVSRRSTIPEIERRSSTVQS